MTNQSTPSRRQLDSSPATSSPDLEYASRNLLTPRSRIKALLASVDDESENDSRPSTKKPRGEATTSKMAERPTPGKASKVRQDDAIPHTQSSEDDQEFVSRPKGRMAARMLGQNGASESSPGSDSSNDDGYAYERVRRRLIGGLKPTQASKQTNKVEDISSSCEPEGNPAPDSKFSGRRGKLFIGKDIRGTSPRSSPPRSRRSSPGLFVSPEVPSGRKVNATSVTEGPSDTDSDLPASPQKNSRFLTLVAKKREERKAQEQAAAQKKAEKLARLKAVSSQRSKVVSSGTSDFDSDTNDHAGKKLTQQARPSRKAGKKALEEMHRETQRMSRNMQLAHEARTRKKVTKESLFAKFNFRPGAAAGNEAEKTGEKTTCSTSSSPSTENEALLEQDTPPTSPVTVTELEHRVEVQHERPIDAFVEDISVQDNAIREEDLPTMDDILIKPVAKIDKGKGRAIEPESHVPIQPKKVLRSVSVQPAIRIRPPGKETAIQSSGVDSDSDLEIVAEQPLYRKSRKHTIFDRLPTQKATNSKSMQTLRVLANLTSPRKDVSKKALINAAELQSSLQRRARQQAAQERAEKLQDLRDRGIIIQTAEEREKDQAEVEDLVDKARREADLIMQKEKAAAKKERKDKGVSGGLGSTSDEDEEWNEGDGEGSPQLSGSDTGDEDVDLDESRKHSGEIGNTDTDSGDEENHVDADLVPHHDDAGKTSFFDNEAEEDADEDEETDDGDDEAPIDDTNDQSRDDSIPRADRRKNRGTRVLDSDDEEDVEASSVNAVARQPAEEVPSSRNPRPSIPSKPNIPGMAAFGAPPLGLTQMFDGTMADAQSQELDIPEDLDEGQDSLAYLRNLPAPTLPDFDHTFGGDSQEVITDSQNGITDITGIGTENTIVTPEIDLNYSQSQIRYHTIKDSQYLQTSTQYSELPDPTQDVGFQQSSPLPNRFVTPPPSTIDTVLLPGAELPDSPKAKKRGRLRRRTAAVAVLSGVDDEEIPDLGSYNENQEFEVSADTFDVMRKAAKKPSREVEIFDRNRSHAKGMVEEQAEESEDEYAGLGGASDEDSNMGDDEEVREMIDDEGGVKVDERQLAAFYADKERVNDEKQVNKLFKDITNGMLRRKRGAEYELSDSDDDGEARRRKKQREFAKMRKALLEDENVNKIATNPKKAAFLEAIEDRAPDDDLFFLEESSQPSLIPDSQEGITPSQSDMGPPLKHKQSLLTNDENRPPPALRRVQRTKKPSNLADIRESLSSLLEEPNAMPLPPPSPSTSSISGEDQERQGTTPQAAPHSNNRADDPFTSHLRRRRRRTSNPVIDRLALVRVASTTTTHQTTRLAFQDSSCNTSQPAFRPPMLLRRATTQVTNSTDSSGGFVETERMAGGGENQGVKRGGTKKSSINYFARESERAKVLREGERKRLEKRTKAMGKRRGFVAGLLGGGGWE